jgi:hypothetical protein
MFVVGEHREWSPGGPVTVAPGDFELGGTVTVEDQVELEVRGAVKMTTVAFGVGEILKAKQY